jgi:hypothetical protein
MNTAAVTDSGGERQFELLGVMHLREACLVADRLDDAQALAGNALVQIRESGQRGYEPWALRLLGEIALRRDPPDVERAEGQYRQALALSTEFGMRPLQAHCHLASAQSTGRRVIARKLRSISRPRPRCTARWAWASGWRRRRRRCQS